MLTLPVYIWFYFRDVCLHVKIYGIRFKVRQEDDTLTMFDQLVFLSILTRTYRSCTVGFIYVYVQLVNLLFYLRRQHSIQEVFTCLNSLHFSLLFIPQCIRI